MDTGSLWSNLFDQQPLVEEAFRKHLRLAADTEDFAFYGYNGLILRSCGVSWLRRLGSPQLSFLAMANTGMQLQIREVAKRIDVLSAPAAPHFHP